MSFVTPRRDFLKHSAWLSLAALGLSVRAAEPAPTGKVSRLRTSLNAYSFYVELNQGLKDPSHPKLNQGLKDPSHPKAMNLHQLLTFTAEAGFDAIDLTGYFFASYPKAPTDAEIFAIKHEAFRLGLEISGSGVKNEVTTADKALRAEGKGHHRRQSPARRRQAAHQGLGRRLREARRSGLTRLR